ncbi:STAS domain-containing protein [Micromonospora orduensis]|uniref:STAS domain-containing protein n=1 Tax=Micromonospora orduensis TaxID=1420891 RepID=UPI00142EC8EE|nr:STAS domain-containing protein [Micromonospora orduensis]
MTDQFPDRRPLPPGLHTPIMSLAWSRDGSTSLITVAGEIDMSNAHLLPELVEFLCQSPVPLIAVDLSAVRFLGAHGITALLQASKLVTSAGARLTLRDPSPFVLRVLGAAGVMPHLDLDGAPRPGGAAPTGVVLRLARPPPARTSADRLAGQRPHSPS